MTDKEFKRLKRADLIEIIYRLQENEEIHRARIVELEKRLDEKRMKLEKAGSIAEAAISLNNVFGAAQEAADQYLNEIRLLRVETGAQLEKAKKDAEKIRADARREAARIITGEEKTR